MQNHKMDQENKNRDKTILLVDDTPENLQLLSTLLAKEGFDISVAVNGTEALKIVTRLKPDMILLDIMMPEMDGYEVCERIKAQEELKEIPIIFVSAKTELVDKIKAFHLGGADYITKPFKAAEVMARVNTHLALKDAQDLIKAYNEQLESMVEQRTKELIRAEKHTAFSLLIKGIVHNLKNPLTSVMGNVQLSQIQLLDLQKMKSVIDVENQEEYNKQLKTLNSRLNSIDSASNKLLELINSLMSRSRTEQSEKPEQCDLNDVLNQELEFLKADLRFKRLSKKNIKLHDKPLLVKIIPSEVSQVIQNLVQNALDAMSEQPDAGLDIGSGTDGRTAWFYIADNGPGIPKDIQGNIFDPFFTTKKRKSDSDNSIVGTGLGLYTCAEIVRQSDGLIELSSNSPSGSQFKVILPVSKSSISVLK